jgi:hypothetical protein
MIRILNMLAHPVKLHVGALEVEYPSGGVLAAPRLYTNTDETFARDACIPVTRRFVETQVPPPQPDDVFFVVPIEYYASFWGRRAHLLCAVHADTGHYVSTQDAPGPDGFIHAREFCCFAEPSVGTA